MTKMTRISVERCGSGHFALKSSRSEQKSLKSIGFEAFKWQREKDSNPHIRSQSPLCYLYTIPLNASAIITAKEPFVKRFFKKFSFFLKKSVAEKSPAAADAISAAAGAISTAN